MNACTYVHGPLLSGTTERVCLIIGSFDGVITVHNYIMDRIMEKPDPNPNTTGEGRLNVERHKQVGFFICYAVVSFYLLCYRFIHNHIIVHTAVQLNYL